MSTLFTYVTDVITWIFGLFSDLFNFVTTDHPWFLFPIGLSLVGVVIGIVFKVTKGLGLRSRRR